MNRIGVIYIGSNSVRLTLAEIEESGYFRVIDELKETIRLGADLVDFSYITEDKINITLSTLKAFKSMCTSSGATKIITVASEALDRSTNKNEFINKISERLKLNAKILKKNEELYYNFLSANNSLYTDNSLMIDINSNNIHLALIKDYKIQKRATLPFGYVTLTSLFKLNDTICFDNNEKALGYVRDNISNIDWLKDTTFKFAIGMGGSLRNLGKIDRRRKRYPIDISHNYIFNDYDVDELYYMLKSKSLKQRKQVEGLSKERADVIVAATGILKEILSLTKISQIDLCGRGLREGILYEYLDQNCCKHRDILESSLEGIMETLNVNKIHARNVYRLTNILFNELKPFHNLKSDYSNIVKTASLLHDCGISIRYYDHHMHSLYIILNSHINGLTHKEILFSGLCAALHRNNSFDIPLPKYSTILNKLDVHNIEKIGVLLKIAEGLDRSLVGAVKNLSVKLTEDSVILEVSSDHDLELEIRQAYRSKSKFIDIYKKHLIITQI